MLSANRGIWQALIPLWFLLVSVFVQAGCSCGPQRQAQSNKTRPCIPQHAHRAVAPPLQSKTIVPGATPASFAVTDSGDAALSISLEVPPGRAGVEPSLTISYSSTGGDGVLGAGFAISGASAITRCAKTMAIDGEIRSVQYDADDALCIDGKRLVIVARNGDTMEYRTFPDTQIKVIGNLIGADSHFEAFLPSGRIVEYGKTAGTRPHARNGAPRAWLATETRDPRGNTMTYGYCFAESDEGFTEAYALDEIRYTGFGDDEGTRTVSFVYGEKNPDDVRTIYSAGMALQSALRLEEVQTSVNDDLVGRYEFNYAQSATTRRTLLQSVQECGADGACKPETRFQYAKTRRGFEQITTTLQAPMSLRASPILADMNGDGLSDWFVPDMTAVATESNPITSWLLSTNTDQGLTAPNQAFLQEWIWRNMPEVIALEVIDASNEEIPFDDDGYAGSGHWRGMDNGCVRGAWQLSMSHSDCGFACGRAGE